VAASPQTFWLENLKFANQYNGWIFSQISPYLGTEVLDVGCGTGNFTELLAQQCQRVVGVDLNEEYVKVAQARLKENPGVEVLVSDATQLKWHQSFDTVVMLDVLEHIEDDVQTLNQLSACLKPGGKIVIKVPALEFLYSPLDQVIGHYRRYTKKTLVDTFEQANFVNPLVWNFNFAGIPGWWLNGRVLGRTTPPAEQIALFNKLVPLFRGIESMVKPPIGLSLLAVATKS
jgi:ubiquinone/menaquinone biosynthesis C-methylase UbiE